MDNSFIGGALFARAAIKPALRLVEPHRIAVDFGAYVQATHLSHDSSTAVWEVQAMSDQSSMLARRVAASMYGSDNCSRWLGMSLEEVRAGYARMRMPVRPEFLNGLGICHGGLMFTLADSTFAFASNSHNIPAVAASCAIEFLRPVVRGDILTAECNEQTMTGRHGIYDIKVTNAAAEVVALFRDKSAQLKSHIVET